MDEDEMLFYPLRMIMFKCYLAAMATYEQYKDAVEPDHTYTFDQGTKRLFDKMTAEFQASIGDNVENVVVK